MALQLSLEGFLAKLCLQALFSIHLLESAVLVFQLFEPLHHRGIHAAKFGTPLIELSRTHAVLTA